MMILAFFLKTAIQQDFSYKGKEETLSVHGEYKIEVWGAQGGGGYEDVDRKSEGGKGAYAWGQCQI